MATPMETASDSRPAVQKEYPSTAFIGSGAVASSDGAGLLYILPIKDDPGPSEPVGIFTLRTGGAVDAPFRIHYCHRPSPVTAILLLSSRYYSEESQKSTSEKATHTHTQIEYDIWCVKIELLSLRANPPHRDLDVLWHRRGHDLPIYATFVEDLNAYLILGGSSYPDPSISFAEHYEPTLKEIAPVPRANEDLDMVSGVDSEPPPKLYPYSWMQTSDTVITTFPLPSNTPKTSIKVIFTTQTLTVHVDTSTLQNSDNQTPIPHYTTKALWDDVNPSSCFWTWDREAEKAYGLLTLHLEKKNEDTRWMQVFSASVTGTQGNHGEFEDMEVPESVDPSELVKIRESFEKWTASAIKGEDASGLGLGSGVPSLMDGELDDELDADIGRKAWVTWVGYGGQTPEWWSRRNESPTDRIEQWEDPPITLLSTPLPGSVSSSEGVNLVLKNDVDGTVFSLKVSDSTPTWEHTTTYPALAFVLASKRDTRFTHHLPSIGVLAFEGGSLRDGSANVYIYRGSRKNEKWAKQSVLQVDNGNGDSVLGVGCVKVNNGKDGDLLIVCLTEGELVLIRGV